MAGLRCFWHYRDLTNGNPAVLRISKELSALLQDSLQDDGGSHIQLRGKTCKDLPMSHQAAEAMHSICKAILCDLDQVMINEPLSLKRKNYSGLDDDAGLARLNNCPLSESASVLSLFCYQPGSGAEEHEDRGLLTVIYSPRSGSLLNKDGQPVVTEDDEVVIMSGKALDVATGGNFPATRHAVATQALRKSLVFRCRGNLNAALVPGYSKYGRIAPARGLGVGEPRTLAQFYREFEALYLSVNLPTQHEQVKILSFKVNVREAKKVDESGPYLLLEARWSLHLTNEQTSFGYLLREFARIKNLPTSSVSLYYQGKKINPHEETPFNLGLDEEDDLDEIDAVVSTTEQQQPQQPQQPQQHESGTITLSIQPWFADPPIFFSVKVDAPLTTLVESFYTHKMQGLGEATKLRVQLSKKVMGGSSPVILDLAQTVAEAGLENHSELSAILLYPDSVQDKTITLVFSFAGREKVQLKVLRTTSFQKIFATFAEIVGVFHGSLRFIYDGVRILSSDTPKMVEAEDMDQIDVYLEQCGD